MQVVKTDILVIGGGIAGCFAAIRAAKMGKSVAILDKATLRRGGSVGPGMDHVSIGVHPDSISYEEARKYASTSKKELVDPNVTLAVDVHAYERVQDMEEFGIPVREDDGSYFIWRIPERHYCCVSYRGVDTKVKLGQAVEKTNAQVFERTMGVELLKKDGRVVGAIGMNTRTGELTAFLAKATILSTGETTRQYIAPDGPYNTYFSPTNTGDAEAMAYRAGAKMVNMEFLYWDYVLVRAGGGIVGVKPFDKMAKLVNRNGDVILNTPEESVMRCFLMQKELIEGRGPLYWDLRDLPEDVIKMHEREMSNEYPITKQWFKQRKLDLRKDLIPMKLDPCCIMGGPLVDETLQTSVPGLYAAGATTAFARAIVGASVTGDIAGEQASIFAETAGEPEVTTEYLKELENTILAPLGREEGIDPKELELAARGLITEYVGYFKDEKMMEYALEKLLDLKNNFTDKMTASNPHELMRCCEVKSIIDYAEMHIRASLYRKETRFRHLANYVHYRADYPDTDPKWEKWVVVEKGGNNEMELSTSEIPELKEA